MLHRTELAGIQAPQPDDVLSASAVNRLPTSHSQGNFFSERLSLPTFGYNNLFNAEL